jgi:hypothetical protein
MPVDGDVDVYQELDGDFIVTGNHGVLRTDGSRKGGACNKNRSEKYRDLQAHVFSSG